MPTEYPLLDTLERMYANQLAIEAALRAVALEHSLANSFITRVRQLLEQQDDA